MSEYIERQKVIEVLENARLVSDGEFWGYNTEDMKIESIPNADVAPVVRGKWIFKERYGHLVTHACSICSQTLTTLEGEKLNFCPRCNAKLDLEDGE